MTSSKKNDELPFGKQKSRQSPRKKAQLGPLEKYRLLVIRSRVKTKKPNFTNFPAHRKARIPTSWRRPKGLDSKTRVRRRGWPARPSQGWRSPRAVRGLHPSGLEEVLVTKPYEIQHLSPSKHCIRISSKLGKRKKNYILGILERLRFRVVNPGSIETATMEEEEPVISEFSEI